MACPVFEALRDLPAFCRHCGERVEEHDAIIRTEKMTREEAIRRYPDLREKIEALDG